MSGQGRYICLQEKKIEREEARDSWLRRLRRTDLANRKPAYQSLMLAAAARLSTVSVKYRV